jgi:hypothetical protein
VIASGLSRQILALCFALMVTIFSGTALMAVQTYPSAITVSPNTLSSPGTATVTVSINVVAPAGGQKVGMAYGKLLSGPSTVTVPEGSKTVTLELTAGSASSTTATFVRAFIGQAGQVANVTVKAAAGVCALESIQVRPSTLRGGENGSLSISLSGPAPAGGVEVMLSSSDSRALPVPSTVMLAEGARNQSVKIVGGMMDADRNVTVTAKYQQVNKSASVTVLKRK